MKTLESPETHYLRAAQGWLDLGNHTEAHEELKKIGLEWRFHPEVLAVRWKIYAVGKHWEFAHTIAHGMAALYPNSPEGWIYRSIALHSMKRTVEAWHSLYPATDKFPKNHLIPYLMARYSCQMGRMDEAEEWLRKAMKIGNEQEIKLTALEEPDLEPLWDQVLR